MQVYEPLNMFFKAAFNGYTYGQTCAPKCIGDNYGTFQYLNNDIQRAIYIWFFMPEADAGDGGYTHPLPLQILVAGKGRQCGTSQCSSCAVSCSSASCHHMTSHDITCGQMVVLVKGVDMV
jgi:hypothetical protein